LDLFAVWDTMIAVTPESVVLLPVVVAVSTALVMAHNADEEEERAKDGTDDSFVENHHTTACCCVKDSGAAMNSEDSCYLFEEWTSSMGVLFCFLMLYILLVTITNSIAFYKFITTWNIITESLREHSACSTCTATRRRTCQEALMVSRYHQEDGSSCCCPICLIDLQDQNLVAACDEGCMAVFHKNCLFEWLEYKGDDDSYENHTSCPCCRKELLGVTTAPARSTVGASSWLSDLSTFLGYYPD
jgi:hypothetical protein